MASGVCEGSTKSSGSILERALNLATQWLKLMETGGPYTKPVGAAGGVIGKS